MTFEWPSWCSAMIYSYAVATLYHHTLHPQVLTFEDYSLAPSKVKDSEGHRCYWIHIWCFFASNSEIKEFVEAQSQKESGSETTPSEAYVQGGGVIYNLLLSIPCSDLHPTVAVEHAHAQCVA